MIVHPWQYEHTIGEKYKQWIADKILIPTPFTLESKATLSFRTMDLIHKPYHVKLPVNVQATSAVRTVSTVTTVDGPKLSCFTRLARSISRASSCNGTIWRLCRRRT